MQALLVGGLWNKADDMAYLVAWLAAPHQAGIRAAVGRERVRVDRRGARGGGLARAGVPREDDDGRGRRRGRG